MSNRDLQKSTTMREGIVAAIKRDRAAMSRQETLDYCLDTNRHNGNARLLADLGRMPTAEQYEAAHAAVADDEADWDRENAPDRFAD